MPSVAIVDYAHTPDALVNVLNAIHGVLEGKGKVITVVGAGGNRDKGKRPIMAKESARLSDRVIITSDNPRFEEPQDIKHHRPPRSHQDSLHAGTAGRRDSRCRQGA